MACSLVTGVVTSEVLEVVLLVPILGSEESEFSWVRQNLKFQMVGPNITPIIGDTDDFEVHSRINAGVMYDLLTATSCPLGMYHWILLNRRAVGSCDLALLEVTFFRGVG